MVNVHESVHSTSDELEANQEATRFEHLVAGPQAGRTAGRSRVVKGASAFAVVALGVAAFAGLQGSASAASSPSASASTSPSPSRSTATPSTAGDATLSTDLQSALAGALKGLGADVGTLPHAVNGRTISDRTNATDAATGSSFGVPLIATKAGAANLFGVEVDRWSKAAVAAGVDCASFQAAGHAVSCTVQHVGGDTVKTVTDATHASVTVTVLRSDGLVSVFTTARILDPASVGTSDREVAIDSSDQTGSSGSAGHAQPMFTATQLVTVATSKSVTDAVTAIGATLP